MMLIALILWLEEQAIYCQALKAAFEISFLQGGAVY